MSLTGLRFRPMLEAAPPYSQKAFIRISEARCKQRISNVSNRRRKQQLSALPGTDASTTDAELQNAPMMWRTRVARRLNMESAVEEAVTKALASTAQAFDTSANSQDAASSGSHSQAPDLAIVFCSSAFADEYERVVAEVRRHVPSVTKVFGCSGFGVIGGSDEGPEEVESAPAISVTLARMPGVELSLTHVSMPQLPDGDAPPERWSELLGMPLYSSQPLSFVILADPSFMRVADLTAGLDYAFPAANKIGGVASAGMMDPSRALFCWSEERQTNDPASRIGVYRTGAAVLALHGGVEMELMVAQGCRPLSSTTWVIERADSDTSCITGLRAAPAAAAAAAAGTAAGGGEVLLPLQVLQRELQGAVSSEQELRQTLQNLVLGLAPDTMKASLEPHDFLIRAMGLDGKGHLVVSDYVRPGQRVRFMVRDKEGAMQDLASHGLAFKRRELQSLMEGGGRAPPFGALLFSCNGRGSALYGEPSYDSRTITSFVPVPAAGFLCNGEIGRMGDTTHLHGFTCAVGVLRRAVAGAQQRSGQAGAGAPGADSPVARGPDADESA
mmetsp:Transcript_38716/g.86104  ORF Transcript_38716/g.86104 Transcript_38716/m.86104 type:complete len:558 (+) Transcript_38716:89-1762(+)